MGRKGIGEKEKISVVYKNAHEKGLVE